MNKYNKFILQCLKTYILLKYFSSNFICLFYIDEKFNIHFDSICLDEEEKAKNINSIYEEDINMIIKKIQKFIYIYFCIILRDNKNLKNALEEINYLIENNNWESHLLYNLLAMIYIKTNKFDEAIEILEKSLSLKLKKLETNILVVEILLKDREYDRALTILDSLEDRYFYRFEIYFFRARILFEKKEFSQAKEYFLKAKKMVSFVIPDLGEYMQVCNEKIKANNIKDDKNIIIKKKFLASKLFKQNTLTSDSKLKTLRGAEIPNVPYIQYYCIFSSIGNDDKIIPIELFCEGEEESFYKTKNDNTYNVNNNNNLESLESLTANNCGQRLDTIISKSDTSKTKGLNIKKMSSKISKDVLFENLYESKYFSYLNQNVYNIQRLFKNNNYEKMYSEFKEKNINYTNIKNFEDFNKKSGFLQRIKHYFEEDKKCSILIFSGYADKNGFIIEQNKEKIFFINYFDISNLWINRNNRKNQFLLLICDFNYSGRWAKECLNNFHFCESVGIFVYASCSHYKLSPIYENKGSVLIYNLYKVNTIKNLDYNFYDISETLKKCNDLDNLKKFLLENVQKISKEIIDIKYRNSLSRNKIKMQFKRSQQKGVKRYLSKVFSGMFKITANGNPNKFLNDEKNKKIIKEKIENLDISLDYVEDDILNNGFYSDTCESCESDLNTSFDKGNNKNNGIRMREKEDKMLDMLEMQEIEIYEILKEFKIFQDFKDEDYNDNDYDNIIDSNKSLKKKKFSIIII